MTARVTDGLRQKVSGAIVKAIQPVGGYFTANIAADAILALPELRALEPQGDEPPIRAQLQAYEAEIERRGRLLEEALEYITPLFTGSVALRNRIIASLDNSKGR